MKKRELMILRDFSNIFYAILDPRNYIFAIFRQNSMIFKDESSF